MFMHRLIAVLIMLPILAPELSSGLAARNTADWDKVKRLKQGSAIEVLLKAAQSKPGVELLPWLEREFTLHAMKATRGNQVRAAKLLGITRATLRKRIERFGITKELTIQ